MRVYNFGIRIFLAASLLISLAGCGKETVNSAPPLAGATSPANGATGVPVNQELTAVFSEAMNPATLSASTFTLVGPGNIAVGGSVAYSAANATATFTPGVNLAYNTVYTGTITTGVANTLGIEPAANLVWSFTTAVQPTVLATVPANGATGVPINQVLTATFSKAMNCATLSTPATNFTLTGPGATSVSGTVTCSGSVATFTPALLLANTLYTATIKTGATDTATPADPLANNYVWTFRTAVTSAALAVIATTPSNNATSVPISQAITATFNNALNAATINANTFTLKTTVGGVAVTGPVTYVAAGSVATFTPASSLTVSTQYTATITTGVTDLASSTLASSYIWTFTTAAAPDTTKPTVVSTIPANLAINVLLNETVSATFSKAMSAATINSITFTLAGPGTTAVAGLVTYASIGNTATFTPTANLASSTTYTATITTGVTDLSGNTMAANYVWAFSTGAAVDTTPPQIVSTIPINGATSVALNQTVSATFNEAMNPLTITTTSFKLTPPSGPAVTATVAYDPINFIATLTPASALTGSTIYTALVTSGATDLEGNPLGTTGPNPWSFTTGAAVVVPPVNLGTAALFGDFGGSAGMTNSGSSTVINGNIGTTGVSTKVVDFHDTGVGCSYTETPVGTGGFVNGTIYTAAPPPTVACPNEGTAVTAAVAAQAAADALTAYNSLAAFPNGLDVSVCPGCGGGGAGELGTRTLAPGIYKSAPGYYNLTLGDLTLDAQGNPNAFWVFQMASYLTVGTPTAHRSVLLVNGAQAKNVFWQVGSFATINGILGGGTMSGTVIAQAGASVSTVGVAAITTINGRVLSLGPSVTIVNTVINVPAP
jgi:hypothetical protein